MPVQALTPTCVGWPTLPEPLKAGILAMVKAAKPEGWGKAT